MLTHNTIKTLQSLDKKKFRQKYNLFLVEGNKIIRELPNSAFKIQTVYSVNPNELAFKDVEVHQITEPELKKISFLQHPKDSVAVCIPVEQKLNKEKKIRLILDGIQDLPPKFVSAFCNVNSPDFLVSFFIFQIISSLESITK